MMDDSPSEIDMCLDGITIEPLAEIPNDSPNFGEYDQSNLVCVIKGKRVRNNHVYSTRFLDEKHLRMAANINNVETMQKLVDSGISVNCQDNHGRTALHLAASKGHEKAVEFLLTAGASPNHVDCVGNTPLHLATCGNHFKVVNMLVKGGTDLTAVDRNGFTPVDLVRSRSSYLVKTLHKKLQHSTTEVLAKYREMLLNVAMQMIYLEGKLKEGRRQDTSVDELASKVSSLSIDLKKMDEASGSAAKTDNKSDPYLYHLLDALAQIYTRCPVLKTPRERSSASM